MLNKYQNFIFDLDGTIINSSREIIECFKKAFYDSNYIVEEDKFNSNLIGPPIRQIIELIAPELKDEEIIATIIKNFRKIYDNDENDVSVIYNGVEFFLKKLKKSNKKIFIATFKPEIPTLRILKKLKIIDLFKDVYTIDKYTKPMTKSEMLNDIIEKYGLEKNKTVMIGDASSDMIAAKDNNIDGIGALWGYGTDKTKLKHSATYTIKKIEELECLKLN